MAAVVAGAIAVSGWVALARGGVEPATAIALGTAVVATALVVPWGAALADRTTAGRWAAGWGAATLGGVVLATLPGGGVPLTMLAPFAVLATAFAGWLAGGVWAARAWGVAPATAQALVSLVALAQCATPCVAEALVAATPGPWRGWAIAFVTSANPLLATGRGVLGWDVWHLPWLYGRSDVASYGPTDATWWGAAGGHALAAAGVAALAIWGTRRRGRGDGAATATTPP